MNGRISGEYVAPWSKQKKPPATSKLVKKKTKRKTLEIGIALKVHKKFDSSRRMRGRLEGTEQGRYRDSCRKRASEKERGGRERGRQGEGNNRSNSLLHQMFQATQLFTFHLKNIR